MSEILDPTFMVISVSLWYHGSSSKQYLNQPVGSGSSSPEPSFDVEATGGGASSEMVAS
jgi:hypothetical protein